MELPCEPASGHRSDGRTVVSLGWIVGARDVLPADNEAVSLPTKVNLT